MANTFQKITGWVGLEALLILENQLVASGLVSRGQESEFQGRKKGDTITIRRPAVFVADDFTGTVVVQDATEGSVNLVLERHFDVTFEVTSKDYTLELEDFSKQLIEPAVVALAQALDSYVTEQHVGFHTFVGTAGDPPDSLADLTLVQKSLNDNQVPFDQRFALLDTQAHADLLGISQVTNAEQRGDGGTALMNASAGRVMSIEWFMTQNVQSHVAGTYEADSPLVNGTVAEGAKTMAIDGASASETIKIGDRFTVANVAGSFVFTADRTATTGDIADAPFLPAAPVGGFVNDAAITIVADHVANMAMHPNAISLAVIPLALPRGSSSADIVQARNMGIRVVQDYNPTTKTDTISLDFLAGAEATQPELGTIVLG